jgi:dTDP-glucose 4,6-dehydratase
VYGPYQYPEKVIPLFVTNLMRGKKVPLYGDGKNIREWLFTEDHCLAIDLIIHHGKAGEVYNIGSGHEITNRELTSLILDAFNAGEDQIEHVPDRLGHDRRYAIDFSKLSRTLGYAPQYTFTETLQQTITWYKNNRPWWEPLLINT